MRESLLEHLIVPGSRLAVDGPGSGGVPLKLRVFTGRRDWIDEGVLVSPDGAWWWIAGGVPRLLPAELYRNRELEGRWKTKLRALGLEPQAKQGARRSLRTESQTIDRFGTEWLIFRDWGWMDAPPAGADPREFQGGLWENTLGAFRSKTFLDGRLDGKFVLDAGCGNGRFTRAALACGAKEVISLDIGWGVEAANDHFAGDARVHVVQASLFDLPIRCVDAAFSIGVLMHTGDPRRAFTEITRAVRPGGLFAVRMYHKGNAAYEFTDRAIRAVTTRLSKPMQLAVSREFAGLGRWLIERDGGRNHGPRRTRWYRVLRNWPTVHHNLDWWSAPVATHHTTPEVVSWGRGVGLGVVCSELSETRSTYGFWDWPEALTILFERPVEAGWSVEEMHCGSDLEAVAVPS